MFILNTLLHVYNLHHYMYTAQDSVWSQAVVMLWGFKAIFPDIFSVNSVILSCRRAHRWGAAGAEKEKADICSVQQLLANAVMLSCSIHVVDFLLMPNFGVAWYMWPFGLSVSTRRIHRICSLKIWRGLRCRLSTRGTHLTLVLLF